MPVCHCTNVYRAWLAPGFAERGYHAAPHGVRGGDMRETGTAVLWAAELLEEGVIGHLILRGCKYHRGDYNFIPPNPDQL